MEYSFASDSVVLVFSSFIWIVTMYFQVELVNKQTSNRVDSVLCHISCYWSFVDLFSTIKSYWNRNLFTYFSCHAIVFQVKFICLVVEMYSIGVGELTRIHSFFIHSSDDMKMVVLNGRMIEIIKCLISTSYSQALLSWYSLENSYSAYWEIRQSEQTCC